ncbi:hypothetical protein PBS_34640 [Paraburkholderia sp. 2C]
MQQRINQRDDMLGPHRGKRGGIARFDRRASREAEREERAVVVVAVIAIAIVLQRRKPDIVRMAEHRELLATVELQGELWRERGEARFALQQREDGRGETACVEERGAVAAGSGTQHDVAHVIGRGIGERCRARTACIGRRGAWPQPRREQALDQRRFFAGMDAANLQVRAVRHFDDTRCMRPRRIGNRHCFAV